MVILVMQWDMDNNNQPQENEKTNILLYSFIQFGYNTISYAHLSFPSNHSSLITILQSDHNTMPEHHPATPYFKTINE